MNTYKSYRNLPALAGICPMAEAMQPGLSVEDASLGSSVTTYAFKRLHQIFTARITAEPIYELKMGFSLHARLCAEHVTALRRRVGELRETPPGLELVPDTHLEFFPMKSSPRRRRRKWYSVFTKSEPNPITVCDACFQLLANLFQPLSLGLKISTGLVPHTTAFFQGHFDLST